MRSGPHLGVGAHTLLPLSTLILIVLILLRSFLFRQAQLLGIRELRGSVCSSPPHPCIS